MRTTKLLSIESPLVLRGARLLAYAVSIGFVLLFIYTALKRLRYPFELEKMESGMLTTVWRLAHGHPLYEKPSLEWAPFLYAPLFFYVSLAFTKLVGVSYTAIRLVSLLSTIGSMGVIYAFVLRETRRHGPAIFSIGFFACLYSTLLGWYDIGRVDSLSIFLLLLGLYATRFYHPLVAVIPWLLASQTKQGILAFAAVAFLTQWKRPGRMLVGLFTFVGLNFATIHLLNKYWDGWYNVLCLRNNQATRHAAASGPSIRSDGYCPAYEYCARDPGTRLAGCTSAASFREHALLRDHHLRHCWGNRIYPGTRRRLGQCSDAGLRLGSDLIRNRGSPHSCLVGGPALIAGSGSVCARSALLFHFGTATCSPVPPLNL